jgi:RING finger protein 113A
MAETEATTVPFFKKKARARPATARQRSASPGGEASSTTAAGPSKSQVVLPKKRQIVNPLIQGTKRARTDTDDGPDVQWRAGGITREEAELELQAMDGEEAAEVLRKAARDAEREDLPDDGQYRGQAAYKNHIKKREGGEPPKAMRIGPQRGSSTIKTVTVVDYQPDVCKDYKGEQLISVRTMQMLMVSLQKPATVVSATHVNSCMTEEPVSLNTGLLNVS